MPSNNRIERVAIVGATGRVGKAFALALVATGKHTVTGIGRASSISQLPAGVQPAPVDYEDSTSLVSALKDQDFLIITLGVAAPTDLHSKIVNAAKAAGIRWVMPNVYGHDIQNIEFGRDSLYGPPSQAKFAELKDLGISYVALCCGFWYEWSLALWEPWFGFEVAKRTVTFVDDGETKITVSTWDQCGRAVAALLSLPVEKEEGNGPVLADWRDAPLYIDSFTVSQRDMLESLHRVLGTTDAEWKIGSEPHRERYERGLEEMKEGNRSGFATAMYTRTFFPNGGGNFSYRGMANEKLGLPQESLDEATKRAVGMVESGFNPFGPAFEQPNWTAGG